MSLDRVSIEGFALTLGQRLTYYRKQAGLKQKELAAISEVSGASISRIEADTMDPTHTILLALASALGITVSDLVGDKPSPEELDGMPDGDLIHRLARRHGVPEEEAQQYAQYVEAYHQANPEGRVDMAGVVQWLSSRKRRNRVEDEVAQG